MPVWGWLVVECRGGNVTQHACVTHDYAALKLAELRGYSPSALGDYLALYQGEGEAPLERWDAASAPWGLLWRLARV